MNIARATASGSGDLLAANNLSDLASAATSATNLGLGTGDTVLFTSLGLTGGTGLSLEGTARLADSGGDTVLSSSTGAGITLSSGEAILGADNLNFNGTAATDVMLKRSATELQVRLGDDSGYGDFRAEKVTLAGGVMSSVGTELTFLSNDDLRFGSAADKWTTFATGTTALGASTVCLFRRGHTFLLANGEGLGFHAGATGIADAALHRVGAAHLGIYDDRLKSNLGDLSLHQLIADLGTEDEGFIDFTATADADATSAISTLTTSGAVTHHIQVKINGVTAWIPASTTDPT